MPNAETIFQTVGGVWEQTVEEDKIIISSRLRLARNIAQKPFPARLGAQEARELAAQVAQVMEKEPGFTYYEIARLSPRRRQILQEKHLISPELAQGRPGAGVWINAEQSCAVMVNEEDHIRIQSFAPGMGLREAWKAAETIDDHLSAGLPIAFEQRLGYLSACPTNVGTGLRASVMLHLPALVMTKRAEGVFAGFARLGLTVRGIYGEGSQAQGNLFQVSNQITLGKDEMEIIAMLEEAVQMIVAAEEKARAFLQEKYPMRLHDNIWRAYGILRYARTISTQEMMERLSQLRLGVDLGLIRGLSAPQLNRMMVMGQPAYLEENSGKSLSPELRDWERAALLRKMLQPIAEVNDND